jgi:ribosomal protein L12E/L44/L45/RPP1/RPP2
MSLHIVINCINILLTGSKKLASVPSGGAVAAPAAGGGGGAPAEAKEGKCQGFIH